MKRPLLTLFSLALFAPLVVAAPTKKPAAKPGAKPKPKPAARPKATPTPAPRPQQPAPTPVVEPVETGPKTWAVLVGVSQYQSSGILSLKSPSKDATGIRDALVDPKLGRIPARQILLLTDEDATRDNILGSVDNFLRPNLQPGDKVVFFLAGHGVAKGAGLTAKSYFLPTDTRGLTTAAFDSSAVPLRVLADNLGTLPASQFVIFVDACREDPTPGRGSMENNLSDVISRGITVIPQDENAESATFFACSNGQRAFEDEKFGHGVFTNAILEGLRKGSVAQKPDGAVNMGRLSSYVKASVGQWAKDKSETGDFEIIQTPELVAAGSLKNNMVLLNLRSGLSDTPYAIGAPRLMVAAPEGARVQINGAPAGVGTVEKELPADGEYTITVTSPGFAPVSRSVTARGGFEQQIVVQMQPLVGGVTAPVAGPALDFYKRADEAMSRQQWEIAEQGYRAAIGADAKFGAPYEALGDLHLMQGRNVDSLADAVLLLGNVPKNAHSLALVSRAYSQYAVKGTGQNNLTSSIKAVSGYGLPKKPEDAPKLAVKAAMEGIGMDANSSEANVALGYALAALDKGKNKSAAQGAWGKAVLVDPTNASTHLGLGYGIRYYALQDSKLREPEKTAELNRAIASLKDALKLRPGYYEAHREMAFCYMAQGNTEAALSECSLARANRGAANDINEIAAIEVAMSGLHAKAATTSTGEEKTAHEEASKGYLEEAKETSPNADLKLALAFLGAAGIGGGLMQFVPPEIQSVMGTIDSIKNDPLNAVKNKLPGGFRLPGF